MREFTTKGGAAVTINLAPWQDAKKLKSAIQRRILEVGLPELKMDAKADILVKLVLSLDCSDEVDAALAPCLAKCLRNNIKITESVWNDEKAREDYYEIVEACITDNMRPLWKSLLSALPEGLVRIMNQVGATPKSE